MDTWVDEQDQEKVEGWIDNNSDEACTRYYTDDKRFALWMYCVDRAVTRMVGISCMDLDDWLYYDAYSGGTPPKEAAVDVLESNGWRVRE